MNNIYFKDEEITKDDLFFLCYMIERVARKIHQRNSYVVNRLGRKNLMHLISVANVQHAQNPEDVEDAWIADYNLQEGDFDILDVDKELVRNSPTAMEMGKVYERLILDTMMPEETYVDGILRIYNDEICITIDNYNGSAYYEPSYVVARAYYDGEF